MVNLITPEKTIEVEAPPCIEVSLFQQKDRKIIHLVNSHTEKVLSGVSFAEYIPPLYKIKVRLKIEKEPKRITQKPENKEIKFIKKENYIEFTVPEVKIYTIIVVE